MLVAERQRETRHPGRPSCWPSRGAWPDADPARRQGPRARRGGPGRLQTRAAAAAAPRIRATQRGQRRGKTKAVSPGMTRACSKLPLTYPARWTRHGWEEPTGRSLFPGDRPGAARRHRIGRRVPATTSLKDLQADLTTGTWDPGHQPTLTSNVTPPTVWPPVFRWETTTR